jgi:hypothetical protein
MDTVGFEPTTSALRKQRSSADLRAQRGEGVPTPHKPFWNSPAEGIRRRHRMGSTGRGGGATNGVPRQTAITATGLARLSTSVVEPAALLGVRVGGEAGGAAGGGGRAPPPGLAAARGLATTMCCSES